MELFSKLGFDLNSLILYIINIAILFGALSYLLYPKIFHFLDERRKIIAGSIDEANRLKENFEKKMTEMDKEKAEATKKMQKEMDKLTALVEQKKADLIQEIEKEKETMMAALQKEIENYKKEAIAETEQKLLKIMQQIVLEIISDKVPSSVIQESVHSSWQEYKKTL